MHCLFLSKRVHVLTRDHVLRLGLRGRARCVFPLTSLAGMFEKKKREIETWARSDTCLSGGSRCAF